MTKSDSTYDFISFRTGQFSLRRRVLSANEAPDADLIYRFQLNVLKRRKIYLQIDLNRQIITTGVGRHDARARIAVRTSGIIFRVSQVIDGSVKTDIFV
jgi:hypothetical protein